ncbi:hypothetical protein TFKS16_1750 [Tannerella forsythia KS16]|uniref:hypothetical protein n=1 Tax=Tannerella forsythia TaxID=28112 RepID=UPI000618BBA1|nr:hypothetical protein [Tannerella forsythia]BAR51981.1 hypothetical protein TFKS16_1750 [Tannerella forsythia KS16]
MDKLKNNYTIKLRCATCGSDNHFEFNEDKSYIKCTMCNREYFGGIEELKELNVDVFDEVKNQIEEDAKSYIKDELQKAFKDCKNIKFD